MKRTWTSGGAVWHRKVNCNCQVDLAATKNIFQERVHSLYFASSKFDISLFRNLKVLHTLFEGAKGHCIARANNLMLSIRIKSEKFKFNFPVNVVFAKVCCSNLHLVPNNAASSWCFRFWLIYWCVIRRSEILVNNKKDLTTHILEIWSLWRKNYKFLIWSCSHLFSVNFDATRLCYFGIHKRLCQSLISCRNNFMKRKQELSNKVVLVQVLNIFVIITVKYLNFESVLLLKLKIYSDFTDKLRIKVVMNDFSLTNTLPHSSFHHKKNTEGITLRKCVHISQFFTRKA